MRIRRIPAEQAHATPHRAYVPAGPFDRELTIPDRVVVAGEGPDDGGGNQPMGSTAQNGFREVKWYRCRDCAALVRETHLENHKCEELQ
jgi:hypothetical protein